MEDAAHLVACVAFGGPVRALAPPLPDFAGRLLHALVFLGGQPVHVFTWYGPQGRSQAAAGAATAVTEAVVACAARLGNVPCFLGGDFQADPLPAGAALPLDLAGWSDLGRGLGPTCRPGGGKAERVIDYLFCNAPARALARGVSLRWDLGFATHGAFQVDLEVGPPPRFPVRPRPVSLLGGPAPGWDEAMGAARLREDWAPVWAAALAAGDLDAAWEALSAAAGEFLAARAGLPPAAACRSPALRDKPAFVAKVGREGDSLGRRAAALLRRARLLRQLVAVWPVGGDMGARGRALLRAALASARAGPGASAEWSARLGAVASLASAEVAAAAAEEEARLASTAAREARWDRWHAFVERDMAAGGGKVFRWVRGTGPTDTPFLPVPGGVAAGPAAELAAAEAAWRPLWLRPDAPGPGEEEWLAFLAALPPFPPLPPLTPEAVGAALRAAPCGKAPGLDGWGGAELRLWPAPLAEGLAARFASVEALGRWPAGLLQAEVVLLPKPGGGGGRPPGPAPHHPSAGGLPAVGAAAAARCRSLAGSLGPRCGCGPVGG